MVEPAVSSASLRARARARRGALVGLALSAGALVCCASRFEVERADGGDSDSSPLPALPVGSSVDSAPSVDAPADVARDALAAPDASDSRDASDARDGAPLAKRVFITSIGYRGNDISSAGGAPGVLGADVLCARAAATAGLTGTFRAWLSDDTQSAFQRITEPGPFYDVNRTRLVFEKNPAESLPLVAIPDQNGVAGVVRSAWTGSSAAGVKLNDCDRWSAAGSMGTAGNGNVPSSWANSGTSPCDSTKRLYCFEK